jgi:hypothetical protein
MARQMTLRARTAGGLVTALAVLSSLAAQPVAAGLSQGELYVPIPELAEPPLAGD